MKNEKYSKSSLVAKTLVANVKKIKPENRTEDVQVSLAKEDVKSILNIKKMRNNSYTNIIEELSSHGLETTKINGDTVVTVPNSVVDSKVIPFSELGDSE